MKKHELVKVKWMDSAQADAPWIGDEMTVTPAPCKSVGWLIHQSKHHVTLASNMTSGHRGGVFAIPRGCIKKIKVL